jgi:hypothetical protein
MEFDRVLETAGMASKFLLLNFPVEKVALLLTELRGFGECLKNFQFSIKNVKISAETP